MLHILSAMRNRKLLYKRALATLAFGAALGALSCTTATAQQISLEPATSDPAPIATTSGTDTGSFSGSARLLCELTNPSGTPTVVCPF